MPEILTTWPSSSSEAPHASRYKIMRLTGQGVQLTNLKGKPQLNGKTGLCLAWDEETGRYSVLVEGEVKPVRVKPSNVLPGPDVDVVKQMCIHYRVYARGEERSTATC